MTRNLHEEARRLIALGDSLSQTEYGWLRAHLDTCEDCHFYAEKTQQLTRSMRAIPIAADRTLTRTTQLRVRARAEQLRQRSERVLLITFSCALVAVSSALSTAVVWKGFEWLGKWAQLANPAWQAGFVLFWIAPTLAASLLFLAHGTHLRSNGRTRQ
ncbi:MAG TPA: hypothetical protein VFB28_01125 [Terriglobales bacterium]|nr:hypothetical protein [Terriglobales bacterium]